MIRYDITVIRTKTQTHTHIHTHSTFTNTVRCVGCVGCTTVPALQCCVDCPEEKLSVLLFLTRCDTLASVHVVHIRDCVAVALGAAVVMLRVV